MWKFAFAKGYLRFSAARSKMDGPIRSRPATNPRLILFAGSKIHGPRVTISLDLTHAARSKTNDPYQFHESVRGI
jgi:hypothetical protein